MVFPYFEERLPCQWSDSCCVHIQIYCRLLCCPGVFPGRRYSDKGVCSYSADIGYVVHNRMVYQKNPYPLGIYKKSSIIKSKHSAVFCGVPFLFLLQHPVNILQVFYLCVVKTVVPYPVVMVLGAFVFSAYTVSPYFRPFAREFFK